MVRGDECSRAQNDENNAGERRLAAELPRNSGRPGRRLAAGRGSENRLGLGHRVCHSQGNHQRRERLLFHHRGAHAARQSRALHRHRQVWLERLSRRVQSRLEADASRGRRPKRNRHDGHGIRRAIEIPYPQQPGRSGKIYLGTKQGYAKNGEKWEDYPGGYPMVFDPKTGKTRVYPIAIPHHGIISMRPTNRVASRISPPAPTTARRAATS